MVKQAKILLQNFPRKHLLAILVGAAFLIVLSLLSNTNLQKKETQKEPKKNTEKATKKKAESEKKPIAKKKDDK